MHRVKTDVTTWSDSAYGQTGIGIFDDKPVCLGPDASTCNKACVCKSGTISCTLKEPQFSSCIRSCSCSGKGPRIPNPEQPQPGPPKKKPPFELVENDIFDDGSDDLSTVEKLKVIEVVAGLLTETVSAIDEIVEALVDSPSSPEDIFTTAKTITCPSNMDVKLSTCAKACYACDVNPALPGPSWTGGDSRNRVYCSKMDRTFCDTALFAVLGPRCTCT